MFKIYFFSGCLKTKDWAGTLYLFLHEYDVPFLPSNTAACLATAIELTLPLLLLVGIFGRLSALGLFTFNFIIFFSYPFLWTAEGHTGLEHHFTWGMVLFILVAFGPGKISLDYVLQRKWRDYQF